MLTTLVSLPASFLALVLASCSDNNIFDAPMHPISVPLLMYQSWGHFCKSDSKRWH